VYSESPRALFIVFVIFDPRVSSPFPPFCSPPPLLPDTLCLFRTFIDSTPPLSSPCPLRLFFMSLFPPDVLDFPPLWRLVYDSFLLGFVPPFFNPIFFDCFLLCPLSLSLPSFYRFIIPGSFTDRLFTFLINLFYLIFSFLPHQLSLVLFREISRLPLSFRSSPLYYLSVPPLIFMSSPFPSYPFFLFYGNHFFPLLHNLPIFLPPPSVY